MANEQETSQGVCFLFRQARRGSLKSSFISLEIVRGICKDETHQANAIIYRRYSNDLKESVYNQIQWAIDVLGVGDDWEPKLSPMKFIYKPTGQEIVFRGNIS